MPYAPATHWDQVFRTRRDTGEDLEDRPLRTRRKPPGREIAPNYILEADGQTMHFFSAAYLRALLTGWGTVQLEFVEIAKRLTGEPFKCVWRGVASL